MKRIAVLLILCLLIPARMVQARANLLSVSDNEPILRFPDSILFKANLSSGTTIEKVKLHYGTNQLTCGNVSAVAFPEITPGTSVSAQWKWDMLQSGGEPPGATIWWQWETIDSEGNSQFSERKDIIWIDDQHSWQTLSEGFIRLHYYYSDPEYGLALKDAAVSALNRLGEDIGLVPQQPIDLYIYESNQSMRDAVFYEPGWTGGLAYSDYNILIIGIEPANLEWGKSTEAHELTHVLQGNYSFSCLGSVPTWLSEGLAVYGEGGPEAGQADVFEQYRSNDDLLSFRVLSGGFSEDPDVADLSYSQSYYMVNYLIQTYGKAKMIALLDALKIGTELEEALQGVYGFDLAGFENEWRASLGLPATSDNNQQEAVIPTIIPTIIPIQGMQTRFTPTPQPTPSSLVPTVEVFHSPNSQPTQSTILERIVTGVSDHIILIIILAGVMCLLMVLLFFALRQKGGQS